MGMGGGFLFSSQAYTFAENGRVSPTKSQQNNKNETPYLIRIGIAASSGVKSPFLQLQFLHAVIKLLQVSLPPLLFGKI